jgi:hypothetical protein
MVFLMLLWSVEPRSVYVYYSLGVKRSEQFKFFVAMTTPLGRGSLGTRARRLSDCHQER